MSFSSRDISKAINSGCPPGSPFFAQAMLDSRKERQQESHRRYGEGVLRNNTGDQPCTERLEAQAAVNRLTEFQVFHARPVCAVLEIYPPGRFGDPIWAVRDPHGDLRWIIAVHGPGKTSNIWRD